MTQDLATLLTVIVDHPELHARWLNTFSYLEYIGFRKIVKSQHAERLDMETLEHAVEEGRHALLLKKLAVKIGGFEFETYAASSLLCGQSAELYFQSIDRTCEKCFEQEADAQRGLRLTYLYVTWLVEIRALEVYGLYQNQLARRGLHLPLGGLLAEEDRHLAAVESELLQTDEQFASRSKTLKNLEDGLYRNYLNDLSNEIFPKMERVSEHTV